MVPGTASAVSDSASCAVLAHRGDTLRGATEDGFAACRQAATDGTDWFEADARSSSDQHMMLMHDPTVGRTATGSGQVKDMTAAQLRARRLDDGGLIPFASQVLNLVRGTHVSVLLELKGMGSAASYRSLTSSIRAVGVDKVTIESTSRARLERIRGWLPTITTTLVIYSEQPTPAELDAGFADGLVINNLPGDRHLPGLPG